MSRQIILNGTTANDGTGDNLRVTADKINNNFLELYGAVHVQPNGDVIIKSNNNTGTVYIGDPSNNHITVPNKDSGEPITIGEPTNPAITVPTVPTDPITITSPVNPVVIGDPACANLTVPQCSSQEPVKLTSPTTPIQIGDPTNPSITTPSPTAPNTTPVQIGNGSNPVQVGDPAGPNVKVPPTGSTDPLQISNPTGPINIGNPDTPTISIPSAGGPVDFNTGLDADRVVVTQTNGKLAVDDSLKFGQVKRNLTVTRDFKLEVSDFVIGVPGDAVTNHWVAQNWVNPADDTVYAQLTAGYSDQAMTQGALRLTAGSIAENEKGTEGFTATQDGRNGINSDTPYCSLDVGQANDASRSGVLIYSHTEVGGEQILQGFGTSAGNQIYEDAGGHKIGQIGNQNDTFWLGTGGAFNSPLTVGSRCITWDTDCKVTLSNADDTGIVVPSPASNDPITIGGSQGISVPRDGSSGPSLGNPGTGEPTDGGSGGPNGGPSNPNGTPGLSIPAPWNSDTTPVNPETPAKLKNPDGPIEIGNPKKPDGENKAGPGIYIPTPGSGDPMVVETGLTPLRVVWTDADGILTVDDLFKYDGSIAELEAQFKTKYVEFLTEPTFATTFAPDWKQGTVQTITLTNNMTLNEPVDLPVGGTMTIILKQDGTGSRLISYQANKFIFASGIKTLTTTANAVDMLNIFNTGVEGNAKYMAALTTDYKA